ncbi:putative ammonium transporter 3-like protein [Dinothrombium tinctorium]|uniref:Putative ammonium transporter 3-like protein n=1 Tax=Dinothrombium tinctorium TaxID=1965070 RepID=A0A3S3P877_9ACAR|nr:putative ammonium transporter 3-like protein [Dinothrombium tinctorium]
MASKVNSSNSDFMNSGDATWILTSSFIIFTMQTGFGLLESASIRKKNEVSMMLRNCICPLFSGIAYWTSAYGLSVARESEESGFFTNGNFFVDSSEPEMGALFASFIFRSSLSATTTTIASGAMAERASFTGYYLFSFWNTIFLALPSHWVWSKNGFLRKMNVVDIAGCLSVYFTGGLAALISTIYLKPRHGRFEKSVISPLAFGNFVRTRKTDPFVMNSPTNVLVGTYMLWWGSLGLNMGSTFGVSAQKWKYAARASIATMISTVAGGTNALLLSYFTKRGKFDIMLFATGLLSSSVAISGGCSLYKPWEAFVIGLIASSLGITCINILKKLHIDDPSNMIAIHLPASVFGMLAVSLIVEEDKLLLKSYGQSGLLRGGSINFLWAQFEALLFTGAWVISTTCLMLFLIDKIFHLRISDEEESRGCNLLDHNYDYKAMDDNLLPQMFSLAHSSFMSARNVTRGRMEAKRSFNKVVKALGFINSLKGLVDEKTIDSLKQERAKNISINWSHA